RFLLQRFMHALELRLGHLTLGATGEIRADGADGVQRILERLADRLERLARLLQTHERDERAENLVGALEDEVDASVPYRLFVGVLLRVADAAGDLQRFVRRAKHHLAAEYLA